MSSENTASHDDGRSDVQRFHFNHAGASPSPPQVTQRIKEYMDLENRVGGYAAQSLVTESGELDQLYASVAALVHSSPSTIALVESATVAWTRAFYSMAHYQLTRAPGVHDSIARKIILISDAEYGANVVAACKWANENHWDVLSIPSVKEEEVESTGVVDLHVFQSMLTGGYQYTNGVGGKQKLDPTQIALVCVTHVPTNSGIINPVSEIGRSIELYNRNNRASDDEIPPILFIVDACQSVGQMDINAPETCCHALVATGRKYLRGPRGTGFLYVSSDVVNHLTPHHADHYGMPILRVPSSYRDGMMVQQLGLGAPREGAKRFEFWESNIASRLGLGEAVRHAMDVGLENISQDCRQLAGELIGRLERIPDVRVYHPTSSGCGIVTFRVESIDSERIKKRLWECGFETSVVPATSTPLDSSLTGTPDLVRTSISYTNNGSEVERFASTLSSIISRTASEA